MGHCLSKRWHRSRARRPSFNPEEKSDDNKDSSSCSGRHQAKDVSKPHSRASTPGMSEKIDEPPTDQPRRKSMLSNCSATGDSDKPPAEGSSGRRVSSAVPHRCYVPQADQQLHQSQHAKRYRQRSASTPAVPKFKPKSASPSSSATGKRKSPRDELFGELPEGASPAAREEIEFLQGLVKAGLLPVKSYKKISLEVLMDDMATCSGGGSAPPSELPTLDEEECGVSDGGGDGRLSTSCAAGDDRKGRRSHGNGKKGRNSCAN